MPVYSGLPSCSNCIALDNAPPDFPLDDLLGSDDPDIPSLVSSDGSDIDTRSGSEDDPMHQRAHAFYPSIAPPPPFDPRSDTEDEPMHSRADNRPPFAPSTQDDPSPDPADEPMHHSPATPTHDSVPNPLLHPLTGAALRVADILAPQLYDNTALTNAVAESGDPNDLVHVADLPLPTDPATVSIYGYLPLRCFRNGLDMCAICISLVLGPHSPFQPLTALLLGLEDPSPT
jgi:hypothetical protein